jgi:hypothetical protein
MVMEEIRIKGNNGTICFDTNNKSDKLRVTAVDNKGHADSHYVFKQEAISNYSNLTYIRKGGRTKFYSDGTEIHPCEYDYLVSP